MKVKDLNFILATLTFLLTKNIVCQKTFVEKNEKELIQRQSIVNCLTKLLNKVYKNSLESGIIATLFDEQTDKNTENLLLYKIFKDNKWSVLNFKTVDNSTKYPMYSFIDMYLVKIKELDEIDKNVQYLRSKYWNPRAKVIFFADDFIKNKTEVNKHVFDSLWKRKSYDAIVILPENENEITFEIFTWFPYHFGHCGKYEEAVLMDTCNNGTYRLVYTRSKKNQKHPTSS